MFTSVSVESRLLRLDGMVESFLILVGFCLYYLNVTITVSLLPGLVQYSLIVKQHLSRRITI